jgi:DNA topoisomerase-1
LPPVNEGDLLALEAVRPSSISPSRRRASRKPRLVKALEEHGIGRPSTYASIISTLLDREYVNERARASSPPTSARSSTVPLQVLYHKLRGLRLHRRMEDELDAVSRGECEWVPVLEEFWQPFAVLLKEKDKAVTRDEAVQARDLGKDPVERPAGLGTVWPLRCLHPDRYP